MTGHAKQGTGRYGRVLAAVLIVTLLVVPPVSAEVCWGKVCGGSTPCCGGNGVCESFNNCVCDAGFKGRECTVPEYCGYASGGPVCKGDFKVADKTAYTYTHISRINAYACTTPNGTCSVSETNSSAAYNYTIGDLELLKTAFCYCNYNRTGACCDQYRQGTLRPSAIDFGTTTVGAAGGRPATVTYDPPFAASAVMDRNMTVAAITISGTDSGDFSLESGTCSAGSDVAGGGNCTVSITFTPAAAGARSATLTITTVDPIDPANVQSLTASLSGTGITPVSSILIDPAVPAHVFAGIDGAGIFRSTNSGGSWLPATLTPATKRPKVLVMKPGDSTTLYAGTYGSGVYRSTDSGETWSACSNTGLENLNVLSLVSTSSGVLYAGTENGVYASTDCDSWTAVNTGLP